MIELGSKQYWCDEYQLNERRRYCDIGSNCHIARSVNIDGYRGKARVSIGDNTLISGKVVVLVHDATPGFYGGKMIKKDTSIGKNCFIGINTVILPGANVGDNCIIGACSVVTKPIPDGQVWAGNPAKFICTIEEYKKKNGCSP